MTEPAGRQLTYPGNLHSGAGTRGSQGQALHVLSSGLHQYARRTCSLYDAYGKKRNVLVRPGIQTCLESCKAQADFLPLLLNMVGLAMFVVCSFGI